MRQDGSHACLWIRRTLLSKLYAAGPACLILDMQLPHIDALELQSLLADRREIPVIFIADNPSVRTTVRAMKGGAIEVLAKPVDQRLLLEAIGASTGAQLEGAWARSGTTRATWKIFVSQSSRAGKSCSALSAAC